MTTEPQEVLESNMPESLEVEIYGGTYRVRGGDAEELRELAGYVDKKMKEVATHLATVDTTKIAILAALNIADELRSGSRESQPGVERQLDLMAGALEEALGESVG